LRPACCSAAVGARRPLLSIDLSCPYGAQQQTHRGCSLQPNDGTDRQTDVRPFHRPTLHTVHNSVNSRLHYTIHNVCSFAPPPRTMRTDQRRRMNRYTISLSRRRSINTATQRSTDSEVRRYSRGVNRHVAATPSQVPAGRAHDRPPAQSIPSHS